MIRFSYVGHPRATRYTLRIGRLTIWWTGSMAWTRDMVAWARSGHRTGYWNHLGRVMWHWR